MLTSYGPLGFGWRPWSRANTWISPKKKRLAGSLVYDTGFPFQQESAGNPGSNPGGRTMFQLKLLGRIATHPIAPDKDVSSDLG